MNVELVTVSYFKFLEQLVHFFQIIVIMKIAVLFAQKI